MGTIHRGRYTAQIEGDFVVFLIGFRINRLLAFRKWIPVARAMRPMVEHLSKNRHLGLLHAETHLYWPGVAMVQYWRSFEQLEAFSRDPSLMHLPAWKAFNRAIGADGSVGIWHETFLVRADQYECIYGNMPRMGLACAGAHGPALGRRETAKRRLGMDDEPAVASYPNPQ